MLYPIELWVQAKGGKTYKHPRVGASDKFGHERSNRQIHNCIQISCPDVTRWRLWLCLCKKACASPHFRYNLPAQCSKD